MLRTALARASQATTSARSGPASAQPIRSIASSSARWAARPPPSAAPQAQRTGAAADPAAQASPADRPPDVPDSVTAPRSAPGAKDGTPFEPIVNDMTSLGGPHRVSGGSAISPDSASEPTEPEARFDPSTLPSLDIDPSASLPAPAPEPSSSSGGRTNARAKPSLSSIEQRRRNLARAGMGALLLGGGVGAWYLAQQSPDAVAVELGKEGEAKGPYERFRANLSELLDYFNKPAFTKLLPDPLPAPHQRPYTLLIDLEGFLTHSSWDRANGWKTAKRPGVDYFLAYLSQFYEIVLFTTQPSYTAMGVADKLDPFQAYLPYKLYRESTRYVKGKIVKDLSYLNRDLSKVILVDTNPEHVALNPENAIVVPAWDGRPGDKGLVDLIPFLESVGIFAPPDVRPILKAYEGKNIPVEYAKREAERKQAAIEEWEREHGTGAVSAGGAGWLSSVFGALGGSTVPRPTQPMTYLESKRAQAQKMYLEEQEYWAKNADEIRRLMEEDRQKQLAEQKGSLLGFMAGPKPPADAQTAR